MDTSQPSGHSEVYYIALLIVLFGGCIGLAMVAGAAALIALPPIIWAATNLLKTLLGHPDIQTSQRLAPPDHPLVDPQASPAELPSFKPPELPPGTVEEDEKADE